MSLVVKPSRPGTLNFLLKELVEVPTVANPTSVIRIHALVTMRLWARTQRVIEVIMSQLPGRRLFDRRMFACPHHLYQKQFLDATVSATLIS